MRLHSFPTRRSSDLGPVLLHVVTKKGKGYAPAENDAGVFHGLGTFDPETGAVTSRHAASLSREPPICLDKQNDISALLIRRSAHGCAWVSCSAFELRGAARQASARATWQSETRC